MKYPARIANALFALALLLLSCGTSYFLGKDLNWDFLNYHFYGPYLLLHGRWDLDYFAGSFQGYLNPLANVPHYLMIRAGWNSLVIGTVLACMQALNLFLLWRIAMQVLPVARQRDIAAKAAVLIGFTAPLFLLELGNSFADAITSIFVLAGLSLLLGEMESPRTRRIFWATLLLGLACGLKLTNLLFAGSAMLVFGARYAWRTRELRPVLRLAVTMAVGLMAGFVLTHGYWSWMLWRTFGNPFFPLFNSIFQSPDFPAATYRDTRFLAQGITGVLLLPFRMIVPMSGTYSEAAVVDVRVAVMLLAVLAVAAFHLLRRWAPRLPQPAWSATPQLLLLSAFWLVGYAVWGVSSSIGRYALILWVLVGPLLVAWAGTAFSRSITFTLAGLVLAWQAYALAGAGNPRWTPAEWGHRWIEVGLPADMKQEPLTVFTLGNQTHSVIVPFLHPGTRVVNLMGQYVQPAGSRMTPRLQNVLATPVEKMRAVIPDKASIDVYEPMPTQAVRDDVDASLAMYGLRLAHQPCESVRVGNDVDLPASPTGVRPPYRRMHACHLERLTPAQHEQAMKELAAMDAVFDRVEAHCGQVLSPHGVQTMHVGRGWMRVYFNSLHMLGFDGSTVFITPPLSMVDVLLGKADAWRGTQAPPDCPPVPAGIVRPD